MTEIFQWCKEGDLLKVKIWLDQAQNNPNQCDAKKFSLLHWACMGGSYRVVEMLLGKNVKVDVRNMGLDTPLHIAVSHGHFDTVKLLIQHNVDFNPVNEHGNAPLHYACFNNYERMAVDLIYKGASPQILNNYGQTPLDVARPTLRSTLTKLLRDPSVIRLQSVGTISTTDKTGVVQIEANVDLKHFELKPFCKKLDGQNLYLSRWGCHNIVIKEMRVTNKVYNDLRFVEDYKKLKKLSHTNIVPLVGRSTKPFYALITQYFNNDSTLYDALHSKGGFVIDNLNSLRLALDIARAMTYINKLQMEIPEIYLNSHYIIVDDTLTARINLSDVRFSFQSNRIYYPAWMSPEALKRSPKEINREASDMWSFAILFWEIATREVPFPDHNPFVLGMEIALECRRVTIPLGLSPRLTKIIKMCMNEDPGRRPKFDMIIPILEMMLRE